MSDKPLHVRLVELSSELAVRSATTGAPLLDLSIKTVAAMRQAAEAIKAADDRDRKARGFLAVSDFGRFLQDCERNVGDMRVMPKAADAEFLGLPVIIDLTVPDDVVELRSASGDVIAAYNMGR